MTNVLLEGGAAMNRKIVVCAVAFPFLASVPLLAQIQLPTCPSCGVSFFIAENPTGSGNLGGLAGADQICQSAAQALGGQDAARTWHAYLSQEHKGAVPRINARDRIGPGPWYNVKYQLIASNIADLHSDRNNIQGAAALDVRGQQIPGNQHDILTGSDSDGRAFTEGGIPGYQVDHTCNNWTSDAMSYPPQEPNVPADRARAMLGHSNRNGGENASWNAAHMSQGCSKQGLINTGGTGKLYCFAIN
jgi:hypothetical protein